MTRAQPSFQQPRHLAGIGVSLAVHVLLVGLWQLSRPAVVQDDGEAPHMRFVRLLPLPAPASPDTAPPPPARAAAPGARLAPAARQQARTERRPPTAPAAGSITLPAAQAADAPPAPPTPTLSSADPLREARAAAGAADRALRKENPGRGIRAPIETAQMKLERGIAHAGEMAPNKWYQAPKTQEIIDPGGYGRRRHRVITANGSYCVTYESNHAPDGIDTMQHGIKPKITSCDADEQPATKQQWN